MPKFLASLNAFTFSGAQVLLVALFPFLAERLELSLATVVGTFGLGSALFLVGGPFWSSLSDRRGRAPVLATGMFGLLLSLFFLWGLLRHFPGASLALPILLLSRVVYGLVASAISPVAQSLQADSAAGRGQAAAMHLHSWSLNIGRAISLLVFLFGGLEPEALLLAYLLWALAVFGLNLGASFAWSHSPTASIAAGRISDAKWVFSVALLFACFVETLNSSLGGFLKTQFSLEGLAASALTAWLLLACALGVVLIQALVRALGLLRLSPDWLMAVGTFSLVAGGFFLTAADSFSGLSVAIALLSLGIALLPPVYLAQLGPAGSSYGKRAGLIGVAHTAGFALGMGLASIRFHWDAIPLPLLLSLIALGMIGSFYASRRFRFREAV